MKKFIRNLGVGAGAVLAAASSQAAAIDYSVVTSGVDVSTVAAAIVAMGSLMMVPNVARWATKKLANFFG